MRRRDLRSRLLADLAEGVAEGDAEAAGDGGAEVGDEAGAGVADLVLWRVEGEDRPTDSMPPSGRRALRLRFDERGAGPVTRVRRSVDLTDLPPGTYRIRLRLQDAAGGEAVRTAELEVTRK